MMHVTLKLESILSRAAPDNPDAYPVPEGTDLKGLILSIGLDTGDVMLAFVDGETATLKTPLKDGSVVTLCPFICGG